MRKIIIITVLLANAFIIFYGCKKEKEETEFDTNTSQDNALAEATFNDVNNMAFQITESGILSTYRLSDPQNNFFNTCTNITLKNDTSPNNQDTAIIDFGTLNCRCTSAVCSDWRYRRGKIIIAYNGAYRTHGTVINTTFDNYYVGFDSMQMFKVTGQKTVTNQGMNGSGHLHYSINVNGQLTNSSGHTMTWASQRDREWIAGESTNTDWRDDEYVIIGSANGTNFEGNSFTVNITSGLHIKLDCAYIKQGIFELTPSGKPTRTLDYGDGTCDAKANVTVNGTTFPILLR